MANIIVAGNTLVVKSEFTLEEIKKIERYKPDALVIKGDSGEVKFRVGTTNGKGSIGAYGVSFAEASRDGEANAIVTIEIPDGVTDVNKFVEDEVGTAILKLNRVEANFRDALTDINGDIAAVRRSITVV